MITNKTKTFCLLIIILLGSFVLRAYQLKEQGLIFYDESAMVYRAQMIRNTLFSVQAPPETYLYVDTKMLWILFIVLGQIVSGAMFCSANFVSLFFGIMTIGVTYFLAYKLYRSQKIALLSSLFLVLSSLHVFYSRLALAESASIFFFLLSVYTYLWGMEKGYRFTLLSGFLGGVALGINRYRVLLLPLAFLIMEGYLRFVGKSQGAKNRHRLAIFFLSLLASAFLCTQGLSEMMRSWGFPVASYLHGIQDSLRTHLFSQNPLYSFLSFFYFILSFEGPGILLLIIFSFLFVHPKNKFSTGIPAFLFLFHILGSSVVDENVPRVLSIILPFICILSSVSFFNILHWFNSKNARFLAVSFLFIVLLTNLFLCLRIIEYQSKTQQALSFIKKSKQNAKVLTTNLHGTLVYWTEDDVNLLKQMLHSELLEHYSLGYSFMIIDPQAYISSTQSRKWNDLDLAPLLNNIQRSCRPVATFDHFSEDLLKHFFMEHNKNLPKTMSVINTIREEDGNIKIYEMKTCLESLSHDPRYIESFFALGNSYHEQGKLDQAIEAYREVLLLDPGSSKTYSNLGIVASKQGLLDLAEEYFKKSSSLDNSYPHAHYNLGNLYLLKGNVSKAREEYLKTLQLDPTFQEASHRLNQLKNNRQ